MNLPTIVSVENDSSVHTLQSSSVQNASVTPAGKLSGMQPQSLHERASSSSNSQKLRFMNESPKKITTVPATVPVKAPAVRAAPHPPPTRIAPRANVVPRQSTSSYSKPTPPTTSSASTRPTPAPRQATQSSSSTVTTAGKRPSWDVKGRLEDALKHAQALQKTISEMKAQNADLEAQLADATANVESLEHSRERLRREIETLEDEKSHVEQTLRETRNKLVDTEDQLTLIKRRMDNALKEKEELQALSETQAKSLAEGERMRLQGESERNALQAVVRENEKEISGLKTKISEHESLIAQLHEEAHQAEEERRSLRSKIQLLKGTIRVFCRVRPAFDSEESDPNRMICVSNGDEQRIELKGIRRHEDEKPSTVTSSSSSSSSSSAEFGRERGMNYTSSYDHVFTPHDTNASVYAEVADLVQSAIDGYSVCIFCYGATGSGKTHTMMGTGLYESSRLKRKLAKLHLLDSSALETETLADSTSSSSSSSPQTDLGIIPRAAEQIFETTQSLKESGWEFNLKATFLEIYMEQIRDLLRTTKEDTTKYEIHHDGVDTTVDNLTVKDITCMNDIESLLLQATRQRSTASTQANVQSSRSHSVFTLKITGLNKETGKTTKGILNLIDLAGSERLSRSQSTDQTLNEAKSINASLSALCDVFTARAKATAHIPYRNSKLTYLLQPCLSGDSRTLMIVNIAPTLSTLNESLCSLRFASVVGQVTVKTSATKKKMECSIE